MSTLKLNPADVAKRAARFAYSDKIFKSGGAKAERAWLRQ